MCNKKKSVNASLLINFSHIVLAIVMINSSCQENISYPDHSHVCILMWLLVE